MQGLRGERHPELGAELNLLEDLRRGAPPERNYASGFGMIEGGYTGSTFEGLWVAGVLAVVGARVARLGITRALTLGEE